MKNLRVLCAAGLVGLMSAGARAADNPGVVPIDASAQGRSYGDLAAAWWKWALETPAARNALADGPGASCANQPSDQITSPATQPRIWFLGGTLFGGSVTRACTIPAGTYLFFPLANSIYGSYLSDPDEQRTEAFARDRAACVAGAQLDAEIDGVPVSNPTQYLAQSPMFTIHLPPDNVYGVTAADVPGLTLDPAVERGYYLFLDPLPPGPHTIHFASTPGTSCALAQDVTYSLTVVAPP